MIELKIELEYVNLAIFRIIYIYSNHIYIFFNFVHKPVQMTYGRCKFSGREKTSGDPTSADAYVGERILFIQSLEYSRR